MAEAPALLYDDPANMRPYDLETRRSERGEAALHPTLWRLRGRLRSLSAAARRRVSRSLSRALWATMALPTALLVLGCASGKDELTKQMEQMNAEIRELRAAALTAQDRLDALEERDTAAAAGSGVAAEPGVAGRPNLEVVRLTPTPPGGEEAEPDEAVGDPPAEPSGPRPVVRANQYGGKVDVRGRGTGGAAVGRRPMAISK